MKNLLLQFLQNLNLLAIWYCIETYSFSRDEDKRMFNFVKKQFSIFWGKKQNINKILKIF